MYSIGDVVFRRMGWHPPGSKCICDGHYVELIGMPRLDALRAFYLHQKLPDELVPCVINPQRNIGWKDVDWDTAGPLITNKYSKAAEEPQR